MKVTLTWRDFRAYECAKEKYKEPSKFRIKWRESGKWLIVVPNNEISFVMIITTHFLNIFL
jgi:hypothetical protein